MVRYLLLMILPLTSVLSSEAQRLSIGVSSGIGFFQKIDLESKFIFPSHSNNIYYVYNQEKERTWQGNGFHSFDFGITAEIDYKRYTVFSGIEFARLHHSVDVLYPMTGFGLTDNWSSYSVLASGFRVPVSMEIKLLRKAFTPFIAGGVRYHYEQYEESPHTDLGISVGLAPFAVPSEMYGIVYNDYTYWSSYLAAGYVLKSWKVLVTWTNRIRSPENMIRANIERFTIRVRKNLTFQKLKKGHYIYQGE